VPRPDDQRPQVGDLLALTQLNQLQPHGQENFHSCPTVLPELVTQLDMSTRLRSFTASTYTQCKWSARTRFAGPAEVKPPTLEIEPRLDECGTVRLAVTILTMIGYCDTKSSRSAGKTLDHTDINVLIRHNSSCRHPTRRSCMASFESLVIWAFLFLHVPCRSLTPHLLLKVPPIFIKDNTATLAVPFGGGRSPQGSHCAF